MKALVGLTVLAGVGYGSYYLLNKHDWSSVSGVVAGGGEKPTVSATEAGGTAGVAATGGEEPVSGGVPTAVKVLIGVVIAVVLFVAGPRMWQALFAPLLRLFERRGDDVAFNRVTDIANAPMVARKRVYTELSKRGAYRAYHIQANNWNAYSSEDLEATFNRFITAHTKGNGDLSKRGMRVLGQLVRLEDKIEQRDGRRNGPRYARDLARQRVNAE